MEQARQSVLCATVDHRPGCTRWAAVTLPAHISTVQGNTLTKRKQIQYKQLEYLHFQWRGQTFEEGEHLWKN